MGYFISQTRTPTSWQQTHFLLCDTHQPNLNYNLNVNLNPDYNCHVYDTFNFKKLDVIMVAFLPTNLCILALSASSACLGLAWCVRMHCLWFCNRQVFQLASFRTPSPSDFYSLQIQFCLNSLTGSILSLAAISTTSILNLCCFSALYLFI